MVDARAAILTGAKAAHMLHRDLGIQEQLERSGGGRIDVFGAIAKLGATLMFQPLDKLLGAYVPDDEPGILISTKRPLPVQRFTGAHELGHLYLRHEPSLDDDKILRRAPFSTSSRLDRQEREADAFASMFLAPMWLLALIVKRQQWAPESLSDPVIVYQLSLRLGTSYSATCHALERHRAIDRYERERLLSFEPKNIKRSLLSGYEPPDWRSDVWVITEKDEGILIEGGRNDLFIVRVLENSSAGYLWSFEELKAAGFPESMMGQILGHMLSDAILYREEYTVVEVDDDDEDDDDEDDLEDGPV
ncbi:MAG: ImmA/IrrE family metallo-endopeptidase [Cytophagaceae bacterium]|nr:MAG: ImmA/IrrE family metallo-endopeptidase [Cytophagaceae bacterium]